VEDSLRKLRSGGTEWIALVTAWYVTGPEDPEIQPDLERTPTDASIRRTIRDARRLGFKILLKPQVSIRDGRAAGEIRFGEEDLWRRFFASYTAFIEHFAALASQEGVELFCIGVELDGTRHREEDWRRVTAAVRRRYEGPLTYAANWNREADIAWWDALDYAGVDAYFPLADAPGRSVAELERAWEPHREQLRVWQRRIGRPVIFTEIGFRSVSHAAVEPWEWRRPGAPNPLEQARLYEATLRAFWDEPWLHGIYWWQWDAVLAKDVAPDDRYSPFGKPAWDVVREFYSRPRPVVDRERR
jgi:hypothetical protein